MIIVGEKRWDDMGDDYRPKNLMNCIEKINSWENTNIEKR